MNQCSSEAKFPCSPPVERVLLLNTSAFSASKNTKSCFNYEMMINIGCQLYLTAVKFEWQRRFINAESQAQSKRWVMVGDGMGKGESTAAGSVRWVRDKKLKWRDDERGAWPPGCLSVLRYVAACRYPPLSSPCLSPHVLFESADVFTHTSVPSFPATSSVRHRGKAEVSKQQVILW